MSDVRKLENGDWVVDLGGKWFRVRANGDVITKTATHGSVKSRLAAPWESEFAKAQVAKASDAWPPAQIKRTVCCYLGVKPTFRCVDCPHDAALQTAEGMK